MVIQDIIVYCTLFVVCGCVTPVMIVNNLTKRKMHRIDKQNELLLSALEKNPNVDVEKLIKQMNVSGASGNKKLIKERLLSRLLWGSMFGMAGLGLAIAGFYMNNECVRTVGHWKDDFWIMGVWGLVFLGIGLGFLANFFIGKWMLAKEMEAEAQNLEAFGKFLEK